ncbi:helix-turn-helix transcriptional regulator [Kordiimonas pumila]|uniref:Helix-turn-helix transcriptional regulator n=1 Tax=Kordiimonas pumila TaxID=2161677 RepID=A0ABV7D6L1_9PROT|nr:helix-turn-helix transcriptional regulator [Kordiimonas pumila]
MKFINPDIGLRLFEKAGTNLLSEAMLAAAQTMIPAKEIFAYRATESSTPEMLLSYGMDSGAERRATSFAAHFFISDPIRKTRYNIKPDTGFYQHVNISQIERGDYRWHCFEKPGFTDKLCFGWQRGKESFVLTFYVKDKNELPSTPLFEAFGNMCLTVLIHHRDILEKHACPLADRLHSIINERYPMLTVREAEICALTLAGIKAPEIANTLGISPNTVLTYRQRAYARLGIRSTNELLGSIIN